MKQTLFAVILVVLATSGSAQDVVPTIRVGDAKRFVGKQVTMCGRVITYECSKARDTALLSLDRLRSAAIGIRVQNRALFGARIEHELLGLQVCATGRLHRIDGRHVLVTDDPGSLVVKEGSRNLVTFAPDAVQSCAPDITLPTVVTDVQPVYTRDAMRALLQGDVVVEAVVKPDGSVGDVRVIRSLDREHGLDQQAVDAVKRWRFNPGRLRGAPVPMIVTIELTFTLR